MGNDLKMKFKAHQSFFVRKGWLSKGLRSVQSSDDHALLMPSHSKEAMDELGLGSNQVVALRYWMETMGLIRRAKGYKAHELTALAQLIIDNDPYTEEIGTLWALHCNLVSAQESAASWYFFFNEFSMSTFSKDDFAHAIERYIFTYNSKQNVALSSLEADFNCIIGTYIPHDRTSNKLLSPESVIDCPLGDLGLMDVESRVAKTYRKKPANLSMLPSLLVLYAMCPTREQLDSGEQEIEKEIKLDTLLDGACGPGRVYNLDSVALLTKLYELESDGLLRINRTAGLDVVRLTNPNTTKEDCLAEYYRLIG